MMEVFRIILAFVFLGSGAVISLISVIGVFRFRFVLNRMHSAALTDSCSVLFIFLGLMIISGFNFTTLKLFLIVVVFWITSPVSGHLLSNMVKNTMQDEVEKNAVQKELEIESNKG